MNSHRIDGCVCLIFVFCVSSNCGSLGLGKESKTDTAKTLASAESDDHLYYLDINKPNLSQPIEPTTDAAEVAKFVQVEVAEVHNPKRYGLTFDVYYQPVNGQKVQLGSFSLYPADNPGKFIVATQGKVKNEGAIVLSMVITDKVAAGDQVKVGVKRIRFRQQ